MGENVTETVKNERDENQLIVKDFSEIKGNSKTVQDVYTTIQDHKKIFNLETSCDVKLNDCKGESMRVKDILIKRIQKQLAEPEINEETGEIKETETKMITILIDEAGKSYVTASKMFTIQWLNYIRMFGIDDIKKGIDIKIIEKPVKNSPNKALGFELL